MKLNRNTKIVGQNIILVPYEHYHVIKYHEWMKSEELQKLTASEPLTLEEEYVMQKSWREDEDKCTFIILDKAVYEKSQDEIASMVGDTNIFITDKDAEMGEIEIMIAEKLARGKKFGWEAVILMLVYGIKFIHLKIYEAKISIDNTRSIKMFEKLNFSEKCHSEVFQEITMEKIINKQWSNWLDEQVHYEMQIYVNYKIILFLENYILKKIKYYIIILLLLHSCSILPNICQKYLAE